MPLRSQPAFILIHTTPFTTDERGQGSLLCSPPSFLQAAQATHFSAFQKCSAPPGNSPQHPASKNAHPMWQVSEATSETWPWSLSSCRRAIWSPSSHLCAMENLSSEVGRNTDAVSGWQPPKCAGT